VRKRKTFSASFKAKVGLEAILRGEDDERDCPSVRCSSFAGWEWKKAITEQAETLFDLKRGRKPVAESADPERLYSEIGKLKMELDWLKKVRNEPVSVRRTWIERAGDDELSQALSVSRQCRLAGIARSTPYMPAREAVVSDLDLELLRLIDEEDTRRPFYGSRRMVVSLRQQGYGVSRKRVQRLMRRLGLAGMAPSTHTSGGHLKHPIYPYRLRGLAVTRPNQVWSTDIT